MKILLLSAKAQSGKDTVADIATLLMKSTGKKVLTIHFADLVKHWARDYFGWNGDKDEAGRSLLQYIGTDVVRKQRPDFWVSTVASFCKFFESDFDIVLVPDTRFPNEISVMKDFGLDVISARIDRPGYDNGMTDEQKNHPSETALDGYDFDYTIVNDGSLSELTAKVLDLLRREKLI